MLLLRDNPQGHEYDYNIQQHWRLDDCIALDTNNEIYQNYVSRRISYRIGERPDYDYMLNSMMRTVYFRVEEEYIQDLQILLDQLISNFHMRKIKQTIEQKDKYCKPKIGV